MMTFTSLFKDARKCLASLLLMSTALLSSCASIDVQSYSAEKPKLDLAQYFNGNVDGWAVVTDRSGKVMKRFTVAIKCSWKGTGDEAVGTLDEDFTYSDGKKERRVWTIKKAPGGKYIGTAADVVGEAIGNAAGNALNWKYTLALPVDGKVYNVQFDDWLWLVDDKVLLNKAVMSKFGFKLAEVTISFTKR
jgi:Protein of unknown function (DUF3833)